MKQLLLASTAILLIAGSAMAGQRSSALSADEKASHIKVVTYSATKRTEVVGLLGQPTSITFPAGESVYRVVQTKLIGSQDNIATAWEGPSAEQVKDAPLGNNLTIWPLKEGTTIMNVITMGDHGGQKSYAFKLIAKPDPTGMPDEPDAVFNVIFRGGGDPPKQTAAAGEDQVVTRKTTSNASDDPPPRKPRRSGRQETRDANEREYAAERLRVAAFNQAGGCHYHGQGDENSPIKPFCALDNGIWTIMRFPGLSAKPTVYIGACDGQNERLARQVGSGDFVVVQEIAPSFCLRLAPYALNIINDAYNPAGSPTGKGTISTGAQRQILQESSTK
jgi:type IV secretory pathway VirB9-like protein